MAADSDSPAGLMVPAGLLFFLCQLKYSCIYAPLFWIPYCALRWTASVPGGRGLVQEIILHNVKSSYPKGWPLFIIKETVPS